jgi:hypothetical protein
MGIGRIFADGIVKLGKAASCMAFLGLCVAGCNAKEPAVVNGLTGIVYNYSQEGYVSVKINGKAVGSTASKVQPGDVSGGGGMCCFSLPLDAGEVEVELEPSLSDGYKTIAQIEKWWPDLAHYGVVHILPGRKVVMELRSVYTWPRRDLLESRLKALGINKIINYSGPMNEGPMERTDGVK